MVSTALDIGRDMENSHISLGSIIKMIYFFYSPGGEGHWDEKFSMSTGPNNKSASPPCGGCEPEFNLMKKLD